MFRPLALIVALLATPALAATVPVIPGGEAAAIKAVADGDTLVFTGAFDHLFLRDHAWPAGITLDLTHATLANLRLLNVSGVAIVGGTFTPTDYLGGVYAMGSHHVSVSGMAYRGPGTWTGVMARDSTDVTVKDATIDGASVAISLLNVDGFLIQNATFLNFTIDGVDMFAAQHGRMADTVCAGAKVQGTQHPDCAQLATLPKAYPAVVTADIEIDHNVAYGASQGWSGFDPPFARVSIHDNAGGFAYPQGIAIKGCTACRVTANHVWTVPGAQYRASINAAPADNPGLVSCGNMADAGAGKPAWADAAC